MPRIATSASILSQSVAIGRLPKVEGQGGEMFSLYFVQNLLTIITCGIYGAWATCKILSYLSSKTKWGQDAFAIEMEGGKLFSLQLKGILLTCVTLGIYYPWYMAEVYGYEASCSSVGA